MKSKIEKLINKIEESYKKYDVKIAETEHLINDCVNKKSELKKNEEKFKREFKFDEARKISGQISEIDSKIKGYNADIKDLEKFKRDDNINSINELKELKIEYEGYLRKLNIEKLEAQRSKKSELEIKIQQELQNIEQEYKHNFDYEHVISEAIRRFDNGQ